MKKSIEFLKAEKLPNPTIHATIKDGRNVLVKVSDVLEDYGAKVKENILEGMICLRTPHPPTINSKGLHTVVIPTDQINLIIKTLGGTV